MEAKIAGKTYNIDNDHQPAIDDLVPVCKKLLNSLTLALLLCKHKRIEDEEGDTPLEYTKGPVVAEVVSDLYFSAVRATNTVLDMRVLRTSSLVHALPIVRGVIETCINATFILAKGDEAAKGAIEHAVARTYCDFDKTTGTGQHAITVSRTPPVPFSQPLKDVLDKFTSQKGKPRNWTELTIPKRIVEIEKAFGNSVSIGLNSAYAGLYSDASEMIHGSYLGALKALGREPFQEPTIDLEAINKNGSPDYRVEIRSKIIAQKC